MENDLSKPSLMKQSGNGGDPNPDDEDSEEEDDADVENLLDNIDDLMAEAQHTKQDCEELEKDIKKVANDDMDEIISDTSQSKSLKRSRENDSDDEAPARKVYKHMEGSLSENISDLENKKNALTEINKCLNNALNEVGNLYTTTQNDNTKAQILDYLDHLDIPQEKKDEMTAKDHSASLEAERKGKGNGSSANR